MSNILYDHQKRFIAWEHPYVLEECGSISSNATLTDITANEVVKNTTGTNRILLSGLRQDRNYKVTIRIVTNYSSEEPVDAFIHVVPSTGNSKGELEFMGKRGLLLLSNIIS